MKFLDERIVFTFNPVSSAGIYKYIVYKDDDTVFVGNIYCTDSVEIDVTDVVRRYFNINTPPFNSEPEVSPLKATFNVEFYSDVLQTASEDILMIYRQPNFNSDVTSPVKYDEYAMPFLQGWKSPTGTMSGMWKGLKFLPTYPAVQSDVFTFDSVIGFPNENCEHSLYVKYGAINSGGFEASDFSGYLKGNIYQYSIPLSELLQDRSEAYTQSVDTDTYLTPSTITGWTGEVLENDGGNYFSYNQTFETDFDSVSVELNYSSSFLNRIITVPVYEDGDVKEYILEEQNVSKPNSIRIVFKRGNTIVTSLSFNTLPTATNVFNLGVYVNNFDQPDIHTEVWIYEDVVDTYTPCEATYIAGGYSYFGTNAQGVNYGGGLSIPLAKIDNKSRYFLKWRDRYGMPQCQPFSGTHTYKENLTKTTTTNWKNTKRVTSVSNQPSWLLNTNWISQDLYPFYEAIFVSPYLQLYDAKEDKVYNVVLTNTQYDEKTLMNQGRKLSNLQLTVELDTTQNILY